MKEPIRAPASVFSPNKSADYIRHVVHDTGVWQTATDLFTDPVFARSETAAAVVSFQPIWLIFSTASSIFACYECVNLFISARGHFQHWSPC